MNTEPVVYDDALEEFLWQLGLVTGVEHVVVTAYAETSDLVVSFAVGNWYDAEPLMVEVGYGEADGEGFYDRLCDGEVLADAAPDREEIQDWVVELLYQRLRAERVEFNVRLHERTQGFLRGVQRERVALDKRGAAEVQGALVWWVCMEEPGMEAVRRLLWTDRSMGRLGAAGHGR